MLNGKTRNRDTLLWLWTAVLTFAFLLVAGHRLAHFHPVSGDDVWIMAASYKWATQGIFGADMFAGFFNADQVYFIALPVQHLFQATFFRLFDASLVTARLPALLSGAALIGLLAAVGRRWFDPLTAAIAVGLLVLWPAGAVVSGHRPPLLGVAQTGRYDLTAVALMWFALWLSERLRQRPSPATAVALGAATAAAALTQFFGIFIAPFILLDRSFRSRRRLDLTATAAFLLPLLAYGLYIARHWLDFVGQAAFKRGRLPLGNPAFFLDNVWREPARFLWLLDRPAPALTAPITQPFSPWLFLILLPLIFIALAWHAGQSGGGHRRLLVLWLAVGGGLALLDATKAPLYAIALWPILCLATAVPLAALLRRRRRGINLALAVLTALVVYEGAAAYAVHWRLAQRAIPYTDVTTRIAGALPPDGVTLGAERWWWGLRDRPYLALSGVWERWQLAPSGTPFARLAAADGATAVILNTNVLGDIFRLPESLQTEFWAYIATCTRPVAVWKARTYGPIAVHHLIDPPPVNPECRP